MHSPCASQVGLDHRSHSAHGEAAVAARGTHLAASFEAQAAVAMGVARAEAQAEAQAQVAAARAEITWLQPATKGKGKGAVNRGLTVTRAGRGASTGVAAQAFSFLLADVLLL